MAQPLFPAHFPLRCPHFYLGMPAVLGTTAIPRLANQHVTLPDYSDRMRVAGMRPKPEKPEGSPHSAWPVEWWRFSSSGCWVHGCGQRLPPGG